MKIRVTVISLIILLFLIFVFRIGFLSDDAYITFRYADNLASGKGLVYNEGEIVEGYTNFLWVIMSAGFSVINIDKLIAARTVSIISALLIILLTFYTSISIFKLPGVFSFIPVYFVALNPGFVLWSFSGMETLFFSLFVFVGVVSALRFLERGSFGSLILSSLSFVIASLTRPEGVIIFASVFGFLFLSTLTHNHSRGLSIKNLVFPILIYATLYGIYFAWRFNHFGHFFPNTFYAKTGFENQQLKGIYYCFKFVRESLAGGFLLIFPVYAIYLVRNDKRVRLITTVLLAYLAYIILIGGDNLLVQRFFVPVIPFIFILMSIGLYKLFSYLENKLALKSLILICLLFYPVSVITDTRAFPMLGVETTMLHYDNMKKAGIWLKDHSKPGESVAVESAGIIPYFSGLKSYDRLGLNDAYISRHGNYGEGERDKSDEEYIKWTIRPDYIVDAFPTLEKLDKPDIVGDSIVYKYYSEKIGEGTLEIRTGVKEKGDLYFNFYKKSAK